MNSVPSFVFFACMLGLCRTRRMAWGVVGVLGAAALLVVLEVYGLPHGYGQPGLANHRRVQIFMTDPWKQDKGVEAPAFWDRGADVARARAVSSGASPLEGVSIDAPSLAPILYPAMVGVIAGVTGLDTVALFDYGVVAMLAMCFFSMVRFGPPRNGSIGEDNVLGHPYAGLLMGFAVLFLAAQPSFGFVYEAKLTRATFWNALVLLRPGVLVALALVPVFMRLLADGRWGGAAAGLVLSLIMAAEWAVYFAAVLSMPLAWALSLYRGRGRLPANRLLVCLAVSIMGGAWFWGPAVMRGVELGWSVAWDETLFTLAGQKELVEWHIPRRVFDPLESSVGMGVLFWLGVAGCVVLWRRGSVGAMLLLGYVCAGYLWVLAITPLSLWVLGDALMAGMAYEAALRPAMALSAGVALAWGVDYVALNGDSMARACASAAAGLPGKTALGCLGRLLRADPSSRACLAAAAMATLFLWTPLSWHQPEHNFWSHHGEPPQIRANAVVAEWFSESTGAGVVLLAGPDTGAVVAARTGRKLFIPPRFGPEVLDVHYRLSMAEDILRGRTEPREGDTAVGPHSLTHIVWNEDLRRFFPSLPGSPPNRLPGYRIAGILEDSTIFERVP